MAGIIVGGGLFHSLERFLTGCVVDYFKFSGLYFNIIDVFIVISVMYFIYIVLELKSQNEKNITNRR